MNRNRAPWMLPMKRTCGVRKNCRTVRREVVAAVVPKPAPVVAPDGPSAWRRRGSAGMDADAVVIVVSRSGGVGGGLGGLAGEVQEDLIEGRAAEPDVVVGDGLLVEQAHHGGELVGTAGDRSG